MTHPFDNHNIYVVDSDEFGDIMIKYDLIFNHEKLTSIKYPHLPNHNFLRDFSLFGIVKYYNYIGRYLSYVVVLEDGITKEILNKNLSKRSRKLKIKSILDGEQ